MIFTSTHLCLSEPDDKFEPQCITQDKDGISFHIKYGKQINAQRLDFSLSYEVIEQIQKFLNVYRKGVIK